MPKRTRTKAQRRTVQRVVFIPVERRSDVNKPIFAPIQLEAQPVRVWTLTDGTDDPAATPTLPITPVHFRNAFLEDYGHDWMWRGGTFRYFARGGATVGLWVLLEMEVSDAT